ncbi:esterase, partial [Staphylococcus saprophyticus]
MKKIGAAMTDKKGKYISDKIDGVMSWCPIKNLDEADSAFEWQMGQYTNSNIRKNKTFQKALSNDLAQSYG